MKRAEFREHLFRMVFMTEFRDEDEYSEQAELYIENNIIQEDDDAADMAGAVAGLKKKFARVTEKISVEDKWIDDRIKGNGWDVSRIAKTDLAALRVGIYEMVFDDDVSVKIAMNEAVNLAAKYGTDNSADFVNGVLASVNTDENIEKVEKSSRVKKQEARDRERKNAGGE